jgi:hypothetical protein
VAGDVAFEQACCFPPALAFSIWGRPQVLVRGELQAATSEEDTATQLALARAAGLDEDKARYMLLDQRTQKARRTLHKLIVREIARAEALSGE